LKDKDVIKHSSAIQITNKITLLQRRAWNVLLANAYYDLLNKEQFTVSLKELSEVLGYKSKDIEVLKEALRSLRRIEVEWNILNKNDEEWVNTSLLSEVKIIKNSGQCCYGYGLELKKKLFNPEMYARISLSMQNKFNSKYSLALYELAVDYYIKKRGIGETSYITIEELKKLMGVETDKTYNDFKNLNRFIIKVALKEINEKSDLFVDVAYKKEGRRVVSLKFKIKPNQKNNSLLDKIKTPIEGGGVPEVEDTKKPLYDRMTKYFKLSAGQALEILGKFEADGIEAKLKAIEEMNGQGKIKSLGPYTYKAFIEDYNLGVSLFETEKQEAERAKREAGQLLEAWAAEHVEALERKKETVKAGLDENEKAELITALRDRYKDNKFMLPKFEKEGLNNPLVLASYENLITEKYLKPEDHNFILWVKTNKGREIEKNQAGNYRFVD